MLFHQTPAPTRTRIARAAHFHPLEEGFSVGNGAGSGLVGGAWSSATRFGDDFRSCFVDDDVDGVFDDPKRARASGRPAPAGVPVKACRLPVVVRLLKSVNSSRSHSVTARAFDVYCG